MERGKCLLTSRLGGPTSAFLISEAGGNKCGVEVAITHARAQPT